MPGNIKGIIKLGSVINSEVRSMHGTRKDIQIRKSKYIKDKIL
jgi:hypothetical protein